MQAEVGVVVAVAVLDRHVVADLKADAVAVVVAGRHVADRVAVAVLQEDAAAVVAVEVLVVRPVAVERQVLDHDVGRVLAGRAAETATSRSACPSSHRFSRRPSSSLKRLPERATSVRLMTSRPAVVRVLRPQHDAVADAEAARVLERDLLIVPVGVVGQRARRSEAILVRIDSAPLPSSRIRDGR